MKKINLIKTDINYQYYYINCIEYYRFLNDGDYYKVRYINNKEYGVQIYIEYI
jgi:hypothetical protein